jgi:hypothetical protein
MNSQKIITYDYLKDFKRIHIKINDLLFQEIKNQINTKYESFKKFSDIINTPHQTLKWEFNKNTYHPFYRLIKIINLLDISKQEGYDCIIGFYHWGSHNSKLIMLKELLEIDENFVEGYSLYLAEGDTGFNGKNKSRKLRFTNSDLDVINFFISWINKYFPNNKFYVNVINPLNHNNQKDNLHLINCSDIKFSKGYYNKIQKYRVCIDSAIIIDLILSIEDKVKEICIKDKKLASAYIRGMMVGEGTVYFGKSRYVRIEMKNEKEIKYLHKLFTLLGFKCKPSLRTTRPNMWSLYIGAKQLSKYHKLIGFGAQNKRQRILEKAVNKRLKINQYG